MIHAPVAALVKSAALQDTCRCTCEEMLRQHSVHQQKTGLSATRMLEQCSTNGWFTFGT